MNHLSSWYKKGYYILAIAFSGFDLGFKVRLIEDFITERDKKSHKLIFKKAKLFFGKDTVVKTKEVV